MEFETMVCSFFQYYILASVEWFMKFSCKLTAPLGEMKVIKKHKGTYLISMALYPQKIFGCEKSKGLPLVNWIRAFSLFHVYFIWFCYITHTVTH